MKRFFVLSAVSLALMLMGCATTVTYEPIAVTNNPIGSKVGEVSIGEGAIYQAAKNGGITKIATVEMRTTVSTGLFRSTLIEIVVTGE